MTNQEKRLAKQLNRLKRTKRERDNFWKSFKVYRKEATGLDSDWVVRKRVEKGNDAAERVFVRYAVWMRKPVMHTIQQMEYFSRLIANKKLYFYHNERFKRNISPDAGV